MSRGEYPGIYNDYAYLDIQATNNSENYVYINDLSMTKMKH